MVSHNTFICADCISDTENDRCMNISENFSLLHIFIHCTVVKRSLLVSRYWRLLIPSHFRKTPCLTTLSRLLVCWQSLEESVTSDFLTREIVKSFISALYNKKNHWLFVFKIGFIRLFSSPTEMNSICSYSILLCMIWIVCVQYYSTVLHYIALLLPLYCFIVHCMDVKLMHLLCSPLPLLRTQWHLLHQQPLHQSQ